MQHFQSILIVIGLLAIGGVLVHGYLLSRKDKLAVAKATSNDIFAESSMTELANDPTDDVLGDVRIISNKKENSEHDIDFSQALNDEPIEQEEIIITTEVSEEEVMLSEPIELEPIELESAELSVDESKEEVVAIVDEPEQPQDLFIFNVVAKEEAILGGHELLQFFLTSGFRFGEMSIFHRHENSDGTGPVLFSIANMMAPGVFEPNNMEQFKSQGVSFFLTAPNKNIDVKASFGMMLTAVEQMAAEFDCLVLNAQREPMTEAQFIEYKRRLLHYI
ncbi:MAG: cell division protein ZipA [Psychromonas sp.]|nr:cell division protein ZipA [Alteromonadales bacterium]MCP5077999.1 cell division protein ZipA [Psychromonas sp.]